MKDLRIYLAGAMANCKSFKEMNEWREYVASHLMEAVDYYDWDKLDIVNPCQYYNFEQPRHQNDREVMQYDLMKVKSSNLIIVNLDGLNTSIGTAIELYESYKSDIPVIGYDIFNDYKDLHPWLKTCLTRVETSINDLVDYVRDFYY